ncbi:hypothetical protein MKEN_00317100 [Mycena kentingensis (nom. inval.)]|nr:hypothetical protein MKEN_00317100 [Mycena kentingensis (nom. inval.)]
MRTKQIARSTALAARPRNPAPAEDDDVDDIIDLTADGDHDSDEDGGGEEGDEQQYSLAELKAAISTAPETALRLALARLASKNTAVRRALAKELLTSGSTASGTSVRVIPRWETCENCSESYDVNTAGAEDCVFHPGDLECEYDRFVDWDEDCHGPMDSRANRRDYPENFTWSCCDADGTASGASPINSPPTLSPLALKHSGAFHAAHSPDTGLLFDPKYTMAAAKPPPSSLNGVNGPGNPLKRGAAGVKLVKQKRSLYKLAGAGCMSGAAIEPLASVGAGTRKLSVPTVMVTTPSGGQMNSTEGRLWELEMERATGVKKARKAHSSGDLNHKVQLVHSGRLERQTYVFVLGFDAGGKEVHGPPSKVLAWSCCDQDEMSEGCVQQPEKF